MKQSIRLRTSIYGGIGTIIVGVWMLIGFVACEEGINVIDSGCPNPEEGAPDMSMPVTETYRVTFTATWSEPNNGGAAFPSNPHFSPMVGATHTNGYQMWCDGGVATDGIESMAELGSPGTLNREIDAQIAAQNVCQRLNGSVFDSPGSNSIEFEASSACPFVSVVSMLAPSPDWFVGVHDLLLYENDSWNEPDEMLVVYDAGTDSGVLFTASNADIAAHIPIIRLMGNPQLGLQGSQAVVGTMRFERIE